MTIPVYEGEGESSRWEKMLQSLHLLPKKGFWEIPGSSYVALFKPLQDVQSRFILVSGIVLAIAAGVPLPIIGVIFARIINAFPPSEDEIRTRISELLAVGKWMYLRL
jgi:ATP-binding cassette, subfamily B (MDR/TAP), member 1